MNTINNNNIDDKLNAILLAIESVSHVPGKLKIGQPPNDIKKMSATQRRAYFKPLIEKKFQNKYPFL